VTTTQGLALGAQLVDLLGARPASTLTAATSTAAAARGLSFLIDDDVAIGVIVVVLITVFLGAVLDVAILDRGDFVAVTAVDLFDVRGLVVVVGVAAVELFFVLVGAKRGLFLGVGPLFGKKSLTVGLGYLVVVGVDFAEGEEPVPIAAEVDESRLQRRFDPGYLGEIDVALDLLVFGRFKVEFLNPVTLEHRHPGFFRVARID